MKDAALRSFNAVDKTLKMEAEKSSETLVSTYKCTRCYNPKGQNRYLQCPENIKSHGNGALGSTKVGEFLDQLNDY
jgi:hypothetical protein